MPTHGALRAVSALLVAVLTTAATATAEAQELPPRVNVSVEGRGAAVFLEERTSTEGFDHGWRYVCTLPCHAVVTSAPHAEHRIVDGTLHRRIVIEGEEGASRVVRYEPSSNEPKPLIVGGVLLDIAGAGFLVAAFLRAVSDPSLDIYGCGGDRLCEEERKRPHPQEDAANAKYRAATQTVLGVGVAMLVVGTIGIIAGAANSSSSVKVSPREQPRRARTQPPVPTWARPELPRPANHTSLLELHF